MQEELENVTLSFTMSEVNTIFQVLGFVAGDDHAYNVIRKLEDYIDDEYERDLFESVYLYQDEKLNNLLDSVNGSVNMSEGGFCLKIKD
jgi:hypothetical protein